MSRGTPAADYRIDAGLLRRLLQLQHPDMAALPIRPVDSGWDNAMLRLGDSLVARLPRRETAIVPMENEQRWLATLAPHLPIKVPTPVRLGRPCSIFPAPWSISPWMSGVTANRQPPMPGQAWRLAAFLRALHRPAPHAGPTNPVRGVPLRERSAAVEERLARLHRADVPIAPAVLDLFQRGLDAPIARFSTWIHGDLHARNLLVEQGSITAVIDWGDMARGDAATDLAAIWMVFPDSSARLESLAHYNPSKAMLVRAKAWAFLFAVILLDTGLVDHPAHAAMGRATLDRLHEDG